MVPRSQNYCRCCGADATVALSDKPRSNKHHGRFFAKLSKVFENWPEHNSITGEVVEFQPKDPLHMRKWLTIQAGYDDRSEIVVDARSTVSVIATKMAIEVAMKTAGEYALVEVSGCLLTVRVAKSIRFETLGEKAFCEVESAIDGAVFTTTGLDPEELMKGFDRRELPWQNH